MNIIIIIVKQIPSSHRVGFRCLSRCRAWTSSSPNARQDTVKPTRTGARVKTGVKPSVLTCGSERHRRNWDGRNILRPRPEEGIGRSPREHSTLKDQGSSTSTHVIAIFTTCRSGDDGPRVLSFLMLLKFLNSILNSSLHAGENLGAEIFMPVWL